MLLDFATVALGYLVPPIMDFIKKKFLQKGSDSVAATLKSLANTNPQLMQQVMTVQTALFKAESGVLDSKTRYFNRDIATSASQWVVNLRAIIRPLVTLSALALTILHFVYKLPLDTAIQQIMEFSIASWFGSRAV